MRRSRIERKDADQFRLMRRAGLVVGRTLQALAVAAQPGVTTADLDAIAREELDRAGATSSFLGYDAGVGLPPYPGVVCLSVNDEVVHGIPGPRVLQSGDLLSIDFGAIIEGWHGDSAITVGIGPVSPAAAALNALTESAMWAGLAATAAGGRIGDISAAVERTVRRAPGKHGIVADFTGHGIGTSLHMEPDVPNLGRAGRGVPVLTGMALAIEPIITLGSPSVVEREDEWTIATRDGSLAAHWEHTVAITPRGLWVLTAEDGGEAELTARGVPFGPLED